MPLGALHFPKRGGGGAIIMVLKSYDPKYLAKNKTKQKKKTKP